MFDRIKYGILNFWDEHKEICWMVGAVLAVILLTIAGRLLS